MGKKSLKKALREWRRSRGYSPAAAAGYLNVPIRTYEGWEQGRPPKQPGPLWRIIEEETKHAE